MLDFQATDAVGMRVQSAAKIDRLPSGVTFWREKEREVTEGGGMASAYREGECRTVTRVSRQFFSDYCRLTERLKNDSAIRVELSKPFGESGFKKKKKSEYK